MSTRMKAAVAVAGAAALLAIAAWANAAGAIGQQSRGGQPEAAGAAAAVSSGTTSVSGSERKARRHKHGKRHRRPGSSTPAPSTPAPSTPNAPVASPTAPSAPVDSPAPPATTEPGAPVVPGGVTAAAPAVTERPSAPPAKVCNNAAVLDGPAAAPQGAISVPAGDNSSINWSQANATYWFAPGRHTLGGGEFAQIVPGNGSTFVGAPGAVLDGQGVNRYAFTQHATNVTVKHLTITGFVSPQQEGVVNHDAGDHWTIEANTISENTGAGVFLGSHNVIKQNCLKDNGQYGFSAYQAEHGSLQDIWLDGNEITGNNTGDWETKQPGCGCTGGGKLWDAHDVVVTNNWIHDNHSVGFWADTNNYDVVFDGNWVAGNSAEAIFYETSYNATFRHNVIEKNGFGKGPQTTFPVPAIYISEAGGDPRVGDGNPPAKVEISGNLIANNWGGVTLWENSDRFCGSPANTSSGYCTLAPGVSMEDCGPNTIGAHLWDCRWRTQNVEVSNNVFQLDRSAIDGCESNRWCGFLAEVSNYGTYPDWSPFKGFMIPKAIVETQNNKWTGNTYEGQWKFQLGELGKDVEQAAWAASGRA